MLGSKLYSQEGYQQNIPKLCEIIGKAANDLSVSEEDIKELESIGISIIDSEGRIHISENDIEEYEKSCSQVVQDIEKLEKEKEKEQKQQQIDSLFTDDIQQTETNYTK